MHKRRHTGGKRKTLRKKRKFEMGRPAALTKLGPKRIHEVRARGGFIKHRAMRLDVGNFSWGSEAVSRKTRLLTVAYNASNNELVRTNTLVKNAVVQIDAAPFRQWFKTHYGLDLVSKKKKAEEIKTDVKTETKAKTKTEAKTETKTEAKTETKEGEAAPAAAAPAEDAKQSKHVAKKHAERQKSGVVDPRLVEQFNAGRLYAIVSSRPGQSGRADGYILEGPELDFYLRKMHHKKKK